MKSEILNLKVFVDDENFPKGTNIYYEKRFNIGNVQIIEYYYNHSLDSFFTTRRLPNLKIIKGYTHNRKLFSTEIIILKDKKLFYHKQWIAKKDEEDHFYEGFYVAKKIQKPQFSVKL